MAPHRILSLITLALLGACLQACTEEVRIYHWKLQSHAVAEANDYQELIKFTENVRVMSGGRLDIKPYSGGVEALSTDRKSVV